jgi:hypothetical protein
LKLLSRARLDAIADCTSYLEQRINGIRTVKLYVEEDKEVYSDN